MKAPADFTLRVFFLSVIVCVQHSMMSVKKESREADFFKTTSDDVVNPFPRQKKWSQQQDLNPRPTDYKSVALTYKIARKMPFCRNFAVICICFLHFLCYCCRYRQK